MVSHRGPAQFFPGSLRLGTLACLLVWFACAALSRAASPQARVPAQAGASTVTPDAVCAGCHRAIYDRYRMTPMARASGAATDGLIEGGFTHDPSGVHYRIFRRDGAAWLSYSRPATAPAGQLRGEVRLDYFVGSNTRGRTYLFSREGEWFEAPVNWYAQKHLWDMAPNFQNAREMPLTLPVDANCLHCHATGVAVPLPGARNHFGGAPFAQGGIGCAACHGDASEHLRSGGRAPVLNPARLAPVERDSICLQCHLEGETAVYRRGRSLSGFVPGQNLFTDVTYFVHQGQLAAGERASSQYEALLESACKRGSGDRLTCTTCHDPHGSQASATPAERVSWFRARCLSCHTGPAFALQHHPEQPDCASCHMPRSAATDVAHQQVTDHRIQLPGQSRPARPTSDVLVSVGSETVSDRETGLAYAQLDRGGDRRSKELARILLHKAASEASGDDPELHTALGLLDQQGGDIEGADREYRAALAADPFETTARGNLATLFAATGDYVTAVRLWQRVVDEDPSQTSAAYDLAVGECHLGQKEDAAGTLRLLLSYAPDDQRARAFSMAIANGAQHCGK